MQHHFFCACVPAFSNLIGALNPKCEMAPVPIASRENVVRVQRFRKSFDNQITRSLLAPGLDFFLCDTTGQLRVLLSKCPETFA